MAWSLILLKWMIVPVMVGRGTVPDNDIAGGSAGQPSTLRLLARLQIRGSYGL